MKREDGISPFGRSAADISGSSMDVRVTKKRGKKIAVVMAVAGCVVLLVTLAWGFAPRGLSVRASDLQVVTVVRGQFSDDVLVRASVTPMHTVILDAVESGRVEEVVAQDGAVVRKGDVIFRLSNSQRILDLLARQADRAQQISNLSNLRVGFDVGRAEDERRIVQQEHEVRKAERSYQNNVRLAEKGFVSRHALNESRDQLAVEQRLLDDYKRTEKIEMATRLDAMAQMERAVKTIDSGLRVASAAVDALTVRAPITGRLTDFNLFVGSSVKQGDHIGRIDEAGVFKLTTQIDEFYIDRVAVGQAAYTSMDGKTYELTVNRIYPQVKQGRFTIDLLFDKMTPKGIRPGQTMDARIVLGKSAMALLLPNAAFVSDSGGAWAYVVDADGRGAQKRAIQLGRRNNRQLEILSGLSEGEKVVVSSYAQYDRSERLSISN